MDKIEPRTVEKELGDFVQWLYANDYVIAWPEPYGHFCPADEKERKQIVGTYLREFKATMEKRGS